MSTTTEAETRSHYWQEQIEAWQVSGNSQSAFCRTHKLNYARFGYWLRKFRRQVRQDDDSPVSGFVPVTTLSMPYAGEHLNLLLPNGMEIRGIDADNLSLVPQLLNQLS